MVPLLPLRDGVRALPISSFRQSMPSFYMNAPDCICSPGCLPLGAFCAGRDGLCPNLRKAKLRISIHAPRVGRDLDAGERLDDRLISIHAPRAGCDLPSTAGSRRCRHFNPRAPCGARPVCARCAARHANFNPRAPCGARPAVSTSSVSLCYFNPRAPCGARREVQELMDAGALFQSTRPVWGATSSSSAIASPSVFQSTRPVWGATVQMRLQIRELYISIHAPRAGCDKVHAPRPRQSGDRLRRPERSENVPGADALCSGGVLRRDMHFLKKKLERP